MHLDKAREFLTSAMAARDGEMDDAAMLGAIHAGICASDAFTVAMGGVRSTDPDHMRAADLIEEVGGRGVRTHARQLRQLIAGKSLVEYTSRRATAREATDAIKRAERLVSWAADVLDAANL